jgi:copper chaperone NosL
LDGWLALFVLVAIAGLADFYRWGYDYGHNLDLEHASIKIPGMAYQPPLIGRKQLLNITASSWPALGGCALIVAMLMTAWAGAREFRAARHARAAAAAMAGVAVLLIGCASGTQPQPIAYGTDECAHCQMAIVDQRYATELITAKGKVYKFDSIECLASFDALQGAAGDHRFVTPFNTPGTLVPVADALIVRSPKLPSPMGADLTAFTNADRRQLQQQYGGTIWSEWGQVTDFVAASRLHQMPD